MAVVGVRLGCHHLPALCHYVAENPEIEDGGAVYGTFSI